VLVAPPSAPPQGWTVAWGPTLGSGAVAPHFHRQWLLERADAFCLRWLADAALPVIASVAGDDAAWGLWGVSGWLLWLALCAQEPSIRAGLALGAVLLLCCLPIFCLSVLFNAPIPLDALCPGLRALLRPCLRHAAPRIRHHLLHRHRD
jgi:hypothetical protein